MKRKVTIDVGEILDSLETSDIIDYFGSDTLLECFDADELTYDLKLRGDLAILESFSDEDIIYELRSRGLEHDVIEEMDKDGEIDHDRLSPHRYYGFTTNQEKERFKKYLCDIFDVNYHTSKEDLLGKLSNVLK